jgi:hypothetical protein
MPVPHKRQVFVSYSPADRALVEKLIDRLRRRGVEARSRDRVSAQGTLQTTVDGLLKSADDVLFVIGAKNDPSSEQMQEWSIALQAKWRDPGKRLVPVLLDNAQMPSFLSEYQALKLKRPKEEWESAIDELIDLINRDPAQERLAGSNDTHSAKRNKRLQYIERAAENLKQRQS